MAANLFLASQADDFVSTGIPALIEVTVGNVGEEPAVDTTLVKSLSVPEGIQLTVLDNGGADIAPENGTVVEGPVVLPFIFTNIDLEGAGNGTIPAKALNLTILVNSVNENSTRQSGYQLVSAAVVPAEILSLEHSGAISVLGVLQQAVNS